MRRFLKRLFSRNYEGIKSSEKRIYYIKFRCSYPVKNGWSETKEIHAAVHAYTESGAKRKLNSHVKKQIQVTVMDIDTDKKNIYVKEIQ